MTGRRWNGRMGRLLPHRRWSKQATGVGSV